MSKIVRAIQKIFGSSAGGSQIGVIGSLNAGSPAYSTDVATIQSLTNYLVGLYNVVIGGNSPAMQDINAIFYMLTYQIAYLMQQGVAEWEAGTTYYIGSLVNDGSGNVYVSIQDDNTNHAVTATAWWRQTSASSLAQYCVMVGDSASTAKPVNTSLIGDIQSSYASQSYTVTAAAPGVFTVASAPPTGAKAFVTVTQNGFTANTTYYVTNVSGTTFKLATTLANAIAGTNITSSGTTPGVIVSGGFSLTSGVRATSTNDNAVAGYVGEYIQSSRVLSSALAITSGIMTNVLSSPLALTPGDWDVAGALVHGPAAGTSITILRSGISLNSATLPGNDVTGVPTSNEMYLFSAYAATIPGNSITVPFPTYRVSIASPTNLYLVVQDTFTVSTMAVAGSLWARRVR